MNALGAAGVGGMAAAYGGYPGAVAHGGFPGAGAGLVGKFRGLKFDGMIGKPGEKKKLTYRSLLSQIKHAVSQGFGDSEVVNAVLKCIPCNSSLRKIISSNFNALGQ